MTDVTLVATFDKHGLFELSQDFVKQVSGGDINVAVEAYSFSFITKIVDVGCASESIPTSAVSFGLNAHCTYNGYADASNAVCSPNRGTSNFGCFQNVGC